MIRLCGSHYNQFRTVRKRLPTIISQQLSSVAPTKHNADKKDNDDNITLLYQRDPNRNALPRASFLVSSLNSIYWVWYVFDFVPAVNTSPIDDLHIDPIYGFGGLGLSILIQSAFTLYPLSLVSKIAYKTLPSTLTMNSNSKSASTQKTKNSTSQKQQEILVWKHTLPFLQTSLNPLTIPLGGITMDKTSDDTRKILEELGGDLGKFEGHLGLNRVSDKENKNGSSSSNSYTINFPLLVEIRNPSEVYNSELMMQVLLSGRFKYHHKKGREGGNPGEESNSMDRNKFNQQKTQHGKKQGHRRKNRGAKR